MGHYYQPEIETAALDSLRKIQDEKIVKQVKHVYENVKYYRDLMDKAGVKPEDIKGVDDIKKLPFLTKADLRDAYPYGLLATDLKNCVRIQSTSGTTGKRVVAFYTQKDVGRTAAPAPSSPLAAQTRMFARLHTATAFSPAAQVLTAAPTRSVASPCPCRRATPSAKFSL